MQFSFLIGSLYLGYQPLYLRLTLYGNESGKCQIVCAKQVLSTKKWMRKETNSASFLQKKYK